MSDKVYFENVLHNHFLSFSFRPDFNDSRYDQVTLVFAFCKSYFWELKQEFSCIDEIKFFGHIFPLNVMVFG